MEEGSEWTALRVQPFGEVRYWSGHLDFVELPRRGGRTRTSDLLDKPRLEEGAEGFGSGRPLKLQSVLLALIQDQEGILRYQMSSLARNIKRRSSSHALEGQGRAVQLHPITLRNPIQ